ncbi:MAG TPA: hypothetical protein PKG77_25300 [Phycisphaerae bacterium]|nr:hypothetical protein [Phycisphaerae bacterium]
MIYRPDNARAFVCCMPDFRVRPELIQWLVQVARVPFERIAYVQHPRLSSCVYNRAVATALRVAGPGDHLLFADADIVPTNATAPLLLAEADVANAIYQTEVEEAFDPPDAFHSGLWRTTREVLEAIEPPWFAWPVTADGTDITGCPCGFFAAKVRAAGFTIAKAGFVRHRPA